MASQRHTTPIINYGEEEGPTPEKRLLAAVLARALFDYGAGTAHAVERHIMRSARLWLKSDSKKDMSFLYICAALDLDPWYVRHSLALHMGFDLNGKKYLGKYLKKKGRHAKRDIVSNSNSSFGALLRA